MKTYSIVFILLSLILSSCTTLLVEAPANNPEAIFENLWNTFDEEYAVFEERSIDWDAQYNTYRPQVDALTSDDELFSILTEMLTPFDDGHITLTAPGKQVFFGNKIRREKIDDALFNIDVIKTYLEPGFEVGDDNTDQAPYIFGKVKDENVAYIYFRYVGDNFIVLNDFLEKYKDVNGYIIDLRHNDGGDFTYCYSEIGRLVDEERYVFRSKTKNGKGDNDYTEWHRWSVFPEGAYVDKPIAVLTDRYTISAGERAVMAFDVLPNVTIMGDTTNGAHATLVGRELANGWFYSLVIQKVEVADGESYEGIGIAPDVLVKNTIDEISNGVDQVLENAVELVK